MTSLSVRRPYDKFKRATDVVLSAIGLVVTAPLQAVIAVLVARDIGRPVLFRQKRPGLGGEPFILVKFRTMRDVDVPCCQITDAERLTLRGRLLRETSLDELPSLWNVLRGDMSIVGPRPLLIQYLKRYTPEQGRRHEVRPGITGLVQISGRNLLCWEDKFELDIDYVDHRSPMLDACIMAKTLLAVLRRSGINANDDATMPEFLGEKAT